MLGLRGVVHVVGGPDVLHGGAWPRLAPTAGEVAGTLAGAAGVGVAATAKAPPTPSTATATSPSSAATAAVSSTACAAPRSTLRAQHVQAHVLGCIAREVRCRLSAVGRAAQTFRDGRRTLAVACQGAVLVRGLGGSAEAVLRNCLQGRALQRPGVGVLAGLHEVVQVEVTKEVALRSGWSRGSGSFRSR